jgi:hypothetical protein
MNRLSLLYLFPSGHDVHVGHLLTVRVFDLTVRVFDEVLA